MKLDCGSAKKPFEGVWAGFEEGQHQAVAQRMKKHGLQSAAAVSGVISRRTNSPQSHSDPAISTRAPIGPHRPVWGKV